VVGELVFFPYRYGHNNSSAVNRTAGAVDQPYLDGRTRKSPESGCYTVECVTSFLLLNPLARGTVQVTYSSLP
jgi:hypothetical protein